MNKNSVIYEDYPPTFEVSIPAKWILVAEDLLTESQYKDWLFYTMQYFGFVGMATTGDAIVDLLLEAVYDEDEDFFDKYYQSILYKRKPIEDKLKVMRAWSKEDQLNAYFNRD